MSGDGRRGSRGALLFVWLGCTLPVAGLVALVERSDHRKAEFCRLAEGKAEGTIVRLEEQRGKYIRYFPVIAFPTPDGRQSQFRSIYPDGYPPSLYKLDQKVPVRFVPSEPARAEIDDPKLCRPDVDSFLHPALWWIGGVTGVCGSVAIGLVVARRHARDPGD